MSTEYVSYNMYNMYMYQFSSVQSLSRVQLFAYVIILMWDMLSNSFYISKMIIMNIFVCNYILGPDPAIRKTDCGM